MSETPRHPMPILKKPPAKGSDVLAPSNPSDGEDSAQKNSKNAKESYIDDDISDDITVPDIYKQRSDNDEPPRNSTKRFKLNIKNQQGGEGTSGQKKPSPNPLKGKEVKNFKKQVNAKTQQKEKEEDEQQEEGEQDGKKEEEKMENKTESKRKSAENSKEQDEKGKENEEEEENTMKKGNRKIKVNVQKKSKLSVGSKEQGEEKKENTEEKSEKKGDEKKEDEGKEEGEEGTKKQKGKQLLQVGGGNKKIVRKSDNKLGKSDGKIEGEEKDKEKEKDKDKDKEKEKEEKKEGKVEGTKKSGKKLLMGMTSDKLKSKEKEKKDGKENKEKKSGGKKEKGKEEKSSEKTKKKKKSEKGEKKKKNKKEEPEEEEAEDANEEDEGDAIDESQLSKLLEDDDEEEESGEEGDIMILAQGYEEGEDEKDENGDLQIVSSKRGNTEQEVDTYWKKNLRNSHGSSGKRKAEGNLYDAERMLKRVRIQRAKMSKKVIMYSGLEQDDVEFLYTAVQKLGEFSIETATGPFMTHLIYSGNKRTMKLLYALAKRAWILNSSYLYTSFEFGDWIAEKECEAEGIPSKKFRDACGPLFKEIRFFFNSGEVDNFQNVNVEELKVVGKLSEKPEEADVIIEDGVSKKISMAAKKFEGTKPHIINYKWILDSLMKYGKLSYQDYQIFM